MRFRDKYSNTKIIDLSDSKSRKRIDNWYSKTGYYMTSSNQGRYSSNANWDQVVCESDINKPPLSNANNYKRGSLSNTPLIKLEDTDNNKREAFNSTVKTDNVSTNLCSLFSNGNGEIWRKKRSYNSSAIHPSLWSRK